MQIPWIKSFLAVAEELHFGRAAQALHIAQPVISQHVQHLERYLGVRVFDRDTKRVALTDAGMAFLGPARAVLRALEASEAEARNAGTGEYGRIRVGHNSAFVTEQLVRLLREVNDAYPRLEIDLDESRTNLDATRRLKDGLLDIALIGSPVLTASLKRIEIGSTVLGVALPPTHPLADAHEIEAKDLHGETLIMVQPAPGRTLRLQAEEMLAEAGSVPGRIIEVPHGEAVRLALAAGIGVAFSMVNAGKLVPSVRLVPLKESRPQAISAVWNPASSSPALENILAILRTWESGTGF
jgi:DNA-binding transcriptional LysR family regulator